MNRCLIILILLLFTCFNVQAQSNFHNIHYLDPYNPEYVKGEVLIKFKDEVNVKAAFKSGVALTGVTSVDELLQVYQPEAVTKIFIETREQRQRKTVRTIRDFKGKEIEVPALFNIYKLRFDTVWDAKLIIEELLKDDNVEFAEPNYHIYTSEVIENGFVSDQPPTPTSLPTDKSPGNTFPNDPLYQDGSQGYLDAINAPATWDIVTGDTTQIIAIIDTGVDWDHPDLDDNIWTNWNEIPDNGIDDDNNGYVDDTRGWDYINNDNDPNDDNSHGTHVAGIAAAEGNNGIGICGVAWNSKIMPIKMLQSSGSGNSSDLASAIEYASDNGATVINMSLGSYGESAVVKIALENAYAGTGDGEGSMLVAAAGNDALSVSGANPCRTYGINSMPLFPAAYSYVLGVMAEDAAPCNGFSNWDFDGPIAFEGYNYEIQAKGVGIISCKPNGSYWIKSGTSMASPEVAGAVALMRQYHPGDSGEEIFAKLIQVANSGLMDIYNGLTTSLIPDLHYIDYTIVDTLPDCDNDGVADAGETLQLYLTIKNAGGLADSVWAKIRFGEFEDATTAVIFDSTSYIGSMSAYSTMNGELDPFVIVIDEDVTNNRDIVFECEIFNQNTKLLSAELIVNVQKGTEISGIKMGKTTLKPDFEYLIVGNTVFDSLYVQPGTILKINDGVSITITNFMECIGTPDSLILFTRNTGYWEQIKNVSNTNLSFSYCIFEYAWSSSPFYIPNLDNFSLDNCILRFFNFRSKLFSGYNCIYSKNIIVNNNNIYPGINSGHNYYHDNLICNNSINEINSSSSGYSIFNLSLISPPIDFTNTTFINNQNYNINITGSWQIYTLPSIYWGYDDSTTIENSIADYFEYSDKPVAMGFTNRLTQPSSECHGVVWKININNKLINKKDNPYNSPTGLGVIGAETLKFEVYFNRPMDTSFTPLLTFGVREPYTQHIVADNASWSADSTIWTAYRTIDMTTGDGIQRVRVANARDDERFEIPIEDSRFEFVIQAAAAASIEFYATPGIGKVELEWPPTPTEDALGYNLYRFYNLTDSTYSDTLMINTELILDTLFTDYNVIPNTTYHYLYKTLGTDMVETDYSKKATATPFSAATGDANGDMAVNVLDITTIVSYILNQNPQPFLSDAADVNYDGQVNLLDIIGVVNLIMNNKAVSDRPYPMISQQKAYYEWRGNALWLHSDGNLAGLQFDLNLPNQQQPNNIHIKSRLEGFEFAWDQTACQIKALLFSLNERVIPVGAVHVLDIQGLEAGTTPPEFTTIFGGDLIGDQETVWPYGIDQLDEQNQDQMQLQVQPNPFNYQMRINWDAPHAQRISLQLYDNKGRYIKKLYEGSNTKGQLQWNGKDDQEQEVGKGIYILQMETQTNETTQKTLRKVIYM